MRREPAGTVVSQTCGHVKARGTTDKSHKKHKKPRAHIKGCDKGWNKTRHN